MNLIMTMLGGGTISRMFFFCIIPHFANKENTLKLEVGLIHHPF